jgi:hypothetical protein
MVKSSPNTIHGAQLFLRTWFSLIGKEIPCFLCTQRFITMFTKSHYWILSWTGLIHMTVFWDDSSCSLVEVYQRFRGACCLCHPGALMMEAASTSETLVNFYQTTGRIIPEDSYLHARRRQNLKSQLSPVRTDTGLFLSGFLTKSNRSNNRSWRDTNYRPIIRITKILSCSLLCSFNLNDISSALFFLVDFFGQFKKFNHSYQLQLKKKTHKWNVGVLLRRHSLPHTPSHGPQPFLRPSRLTQIIVFLIFTVVVSVSLSWFSFS